ncbi:hypothetical protein [Streptomyces sp. NPDC056883]|uniref:hypothetical protein n=1 Tax=Streptomyces sp. NPDC056883 TaxID=3345959 RepID=UPI00368C524F
MIGTGRTGLAAATTADGPARRLARAAVSLAPFTAALVAFKTTLDYLLPEDWFASSALRIVFAGLCSLCVGLLLHVWGQRLAPAPPPAPPLPDGRPPAVDAREVLGDAVRGVLAEYREVTRQGAELAGWSQYLDDHQVPPTAVGTSYGLRVLTAFDVREPRADRQRVLGSLLALQKPGGGWAASTQRDRGRPEITAWVLAAMVRSGLVDSATRSALVRVLEDMLDPENDPMGMDRTTVVTAALTALAEVAPASPALPVLAERLLGAGHRDGTGAGARQHWGESARGPGRSVAHTARAVCALHAYATRVPAAGALLGNEIRAGLTWLCEEDPDLRTTDEQLRRPVGDGTVDVLVIGHFTAAWVARALMLPITHELPSSQERLRTAVAEVLRGCDNGTWRWHDQTRPIWMTYQGATVLRDFALRNTTWL